MPPIDTAVTLSVPVLLAHTLTTAKVLAVAHGDALFCRLVGAVWVYFTTSISVFAMEMVAMHMTALEMVAMGVAAMELVAINVKAMHMAGVRLAMSHRVLHVTVWYVLS